MTRYPEIEVQLTGTDGNAMSVMSKVTRALRQHGHADEVSEFMAEAMSGDYDNVLVTCMKWVSVS
jgi:hypothetical protein